MKTDFHSHFLDDSAQNTDTKFEHMNNFIHWMYENTFFIKDGIMYDTIYVCSKQYRYANAMWLLSVLAFTYKVIIDICIDSPGNVRIRIDGSENSYLKKMCMIGTEESNN